MKDCLEQNINYRHRENPVDTYNVTCWEDCAKLCQERSDCKYWTWHKEVAQQYAYICATMTEGISYEDSNCISGPKDCLVNPGKIKTQSGSPLFLTFELTPSPLLVKIPRFTLEA